MPEPLIPFKLVQSITANPDTIGIRCFFIASNFVSGVPELSAMVQKLEPANYNLLAYLISFLYSISLHSKENKMTIDNLYSHVHLSSDIL